MIRPDIINTLLAEAQQRRTFAVEERALSLIESLHDQLDAEMKGWEFAGGIGSPAYSLKAIPSADLDTLRRESRRAYYQHPYGRNLVNSYVKFVIGKGIIIDFQEKNKEGLLAITSWWKQFKKLNRWFSLQREAVIRSLRDGEFFLRRFSLPGTPPTLRFIDPENVRSLNPLVHNDGIETDPDDVEHILAYHVQQGATSTSIPADEVLHFKMGVDRNVRRGRPLLESMLGYLTKYDKWLEARIVLNLVRTSFALVRHVKGSPTNLTTLRSATATNKTYLNETDKTKMLRPGTIISATPGVEYEMIGPNLEARDAAQDGRTILMALAAGGGLPDVFVTMDFSNSNFASTVVAQNPAIRTFEEHQEIYTEPFSAVIEWCLEDGIMQEVIPATVVDVDGERAIDLSHEIAYPPLLKRDLLNETSAWEKMMSLEIASGRTASLNLGLDPDQEKAFRTEESISSHPSVKKPKKINLPPKGVADRKPREDVIGAAV